MLSLIFNHFIWNEEEITRTMPNMKLANILITTL